MTILPKGGVLINIHTSLTVRVYNIHTLQTLDNRIYVCMYVSIIYVCIRTSLPPEAPDACAYARSVVLIIAHLFDVWM